MIRLHIIAEGQSEEAFVNMVLAGYLSKFGIITDVQCITTSVQRGKIYHGGFGNYEHLKRDIVKRMKTDNGPDSYVTTLFDFYGIPDNFPGKDDV